LAGLTAIGFVTWGFLTSLIFMCVPPIDRVIRYLAGLTAIGLVTWGFLTSLIFICVPPILSNDQLLGRADGNRLRDPRFSDELGLHLRSSNFVE